MGDLNKNQKLMKRDKIIVSGYMKTKSVSRELIYKVQDYINFIYDEKNDIAEDEASQTLKKLSKNLQNQLKKEINSSYVKKISIINDLFSSKTKDKMVFIMEEATYSPGEYIF